jgi:hypothetical protein
MEEMAHARRRMTVSSEPSGDFPRSGIPNGKQRASPVKWAVVAVVSCAALVFTVRFIVGSEPDSAKVEPIGQAVGSRASNRIAFRLTNHHKRSIRFSYLTEVKTANRWPIEGGLRANGSTSPFPRLNAELKAGQSTVVSVTKPAVGRWRILVCYSKETFKRDEITFKISQRLSIWGWDSIAERIRSEKFLLHVISSPELGE